MYQRIKQRFQALGPLFVLIVLIPSVCSFIYFGMIASDVYISESRYVVRSPEKSAPSSLGMLLKSGGFTNASDQIFAAQAYLSSRDALHELDKGNAFKKAFSTGDISIFNRFDPLGLDGSFEALYRYYQSRIGVEFDSATSITTLSVRAYDPATARKLNENMLRMAEATVNRLNVRGRQDLIQFAVAEVAQAKDRSRKAALALSAFRNERGIVDPEKQAAIQLQMISKIQDELITARTQLSEIREYAPQSPQVPVLRTRIAGLEEEIRRESGLIAGDRKSLAAATAQYQQLSLEAEFSDRQLAAAMASLQDAQNEARRKQAYVERLAEPNTPDAALEPHRLRGILTTIMMCLVVWGVAAMLIAGVKEHRH
ncbi:capsular polysaccharide transport system permease protein [Novosphingobium hassiacum]|uniref:Capsular polysaccharide transport system permease protein n=1 Tax=Novosphingobium hassiacum TaxID=173676 RepID=A0A7W5ZWG0_9SPHN|nr:hypothetical protein [Novosphingobium hassiacum]MBB3859417.1 capsular polysaccharide transport system permease protein [Novosphingobium hassiacum]